MVQRLQKSKLSRSRAVSVSEGESPRRDPEPIAIVGIGCRFPGGVYSPETFWHLLCQGLDAITAIPADRSDLRELYDPTPGVPGKVIANEGGFLSDVDKFDPYSFGISPREATFIDPQQRLLLELVWEAFEDGGIVPSKLARTSTGVYIGLWTSDYEARMYAATSDIDLYITTGGGRYSASGRLSYVFDLRGPSMTIDTACSSSLVAVHLACQSLRSGETDLAIAGGVNLLLEPQISIGYSKSKMLSPDARCRFGDARANGYVRSEGAGVILLKPFERAIADEDTIYAVIRGSAVNNDGQGGLFVAPSKDGQEAVLRQAYRNAGIDPAQVHYVEAHGTGTAVGDPVELQALGAVLGERRLEHRPVSVGSVKTNIGHTEAASGIAGLIKAALCLKHRTIPRSLHLQVPNPRVPWQELSLCIPQVSTSLQTGSEAALAGVNSFGVTGTNAHVVLEEAPSRRATSDPVNPDGHRRQSVFLLPLSAPRRDALTEMAALWRAFLAKDETASQPLDDICYTASVRRRHHEYRATFIGKSRQELIQRLENFPANSNFEKPGNGPEKNGRLVFVFTGQGPQWFAMGRELLEHDPVYHRVMERCDKLLRAHSHWSLLDELQATESESRLGETEIAQPVIFALQVALAELWRSWGVVPDVVIGHSMGEVAAAHVAGALTLEEALKIIYHRGRLMQQATGKGKMASVEVSEAEASKLLENYTGCVSIAAVNSPTSAVLSGESIALMEILQILEKRGIPTHLLPVNYAFHSPQMEPFQADLVHTLKHVKPLNTSVPMISTVTGQSIQGGDLDAVYWGRNIREPVRFADAITTAMSEAFNASVFLEIGPHPVLGGSIAQCAGMVSRPVSVLCSLRRGREEQGSLYAALGELYCGGRPVEWRTLYPSGGRLVKLPSYPWQRERYWIDETKTSAPALPVPPVSGIRADSTQPLRTDWLYRIDWEQKNRGDRHPADRSAAYLPTPEELVHSLRAHFPELSERHDLRQYLEAWKDLEHLALAYVLQAALRFGCEDVIADRNALAAMLGIGKRHRLYFENLLRALENTKMLDQGDGRWKLNVPPELEDPTRQSQELLRKHPKCRIEIELLSRCGERITDVLTGRCDPLQLLFPENNSPSVADLYSGAPFMNTANALVREIIVEVLARLPKENRLRILELGAGTGGTTQHVLSSLPADQAEYMFTDVSNSFLISAAQNFSSFPFLQYRLLDVEREPTAQGFATAGFDIIIASNVLHATADLTRTITHVRQLLAPGGLLILVEGTAPQRWLDVIFGMLEGWWKFADHDLRPGHALISQEAWLDLLERQGFDLATAFSGESEGGLARQAIVIAKAPQPETNQYTTDQWLVFGDGRGLATELGELLTNRGQRCLLVSAGGAFRRSGVGRFEIDPGNPGDFERVVSEALAQKSDENASLRIVHLWGLDNTPLLETTAARLQEDQLSTCGSIVHLVQALEKSACKARLWLVTREAQPVTTREALAVTQAPVWGLGRVIGLEHPEILQGLIDLDETASITAQALRLWHEIGEDRSDMEDQIAIRGNDCYVPRLVRFSSARALAFDESSPRTPLFVSDGAYLITGGLGRLGLIVAHWMARNGARHLTLVSRREIPKRSSWGELAPGTSMHHVVRQLQTIEELGATVNVYSGDVGDYAGMTRLVAMFGKSAPPLRGIIHGSAALDFDLLKDMNLAAFKASMHPKILGAWILHELTKELSLDLFVTFSSIASVWGIKGRAHYAAGNEFLDVLAHHRHSMGLPALSVNWGWWSGGGTTTEADRSAIEVGLEAMSAAEALELLGHFLSGERVPQVTIAACDWRVMKPNYEAKRRRPLLDKVVVVPLGTENQRSLKQDRLLQRLREVPVHERPALVRAHVSDEVGSVLGVFDPSSLDPQQGFFKMGMDSLMSVQLRQRLENSLGGCSLPLTIAFEYPTIASLSQYLLCEVLRLETASRQPSESIGEKGNGSTQDEHDRLSEEEMADLLAQKLQQLR